MKDFREFREAAPKMKADASIMQMVMAEIKKLPFTVKENGKSIILSDDSWNGRTVKLTISGKDLNYQVNEGEDS